MLNSNPTHQFMSPTASKLIGSLNKSSQSAKKGSFKKKSASKPNLLVNTLFVPQTFKTKEDTSHSPYVRKRQASNTIN